MSRNMTGVMRRLSVLLVLVLVMAGCSGAERDAVVVGDRSLTREELLGYSRLVAELSQQYDAANETTLDAANVRLATQDAVGVMARIEAIEATVDGNGDIFTAVQREAAGVELKSIIDQQRAGIDTGQRRVPLTEFVTGYAPSSPGYEFVIDILALNIFVAENPDVIEFVRTESVAEIMQSAEVESRIGVWSPTTGEVLRPSGVSDADTSLLRRQAENS